MQEVRNPYMLVAGLDSNLLDLGFIWIGIENEDPETNPKTAYWDVNGNVPVEQPIRTLSGMPDSSGSPGQIFTSGKYSIRVRNAQGEQVFYTASAGDAETTNAGDPYHVHGQFLGDAPDVQRIVCKHVFGVSVGFDADLPDAAYLDALTLPADDCVFSMQKNGVEYGTWTVDATGDSTISCDEQSFAIADVFTLVSPDTSTAIADFALTMIGAAA